jgi:integrase
MVIPTTLHARYMVSPIGLRINRKEQVMGNTKKGERGSFTYNGKRYFVRGNTKKELQENIQKRKDELRKAVITERILVKDYIPRYLKASKEGKLEPKSYRNVEGYFRNYVTPIIGDMMVCDVRPIHCLEVMNGLMGMSGSYIRKVYHYMGAMFDSAKINGLAASNPAKDIPNHELPIGVDGSHRAITPYERKIFLKACDISPHGLWALYMLYTGAGPAESAQLKGSHIDIRNRQIFIDGTKNNRKGDPNIRKRWVPMDDELYKRFSKVKLEPFQYVFTNKHGGKLTSSNLKKMWTTITKEMNIIMGCKTDYGKLRRLIPPYPLATDFTMYNLRHTYATDMRDAGVDITVLKTFMGHSTTKMLEKIYIDDTKFAFDDARRKVVEYKKRLHLLRYKYESKVVGHSKYDISNAKRLDEKKYEALRIC